MLLSSLAIKYSYLTLSKEMKKNRKLGKGYVLNVLNVLKVFEGTLSPLVMAGPPPIKNITIINS